MDIGAERDKALALYTRWLSSDDPFPVDGDELRLHKKKESLERCLQTNFQLGTDYTCSPVQVDNKQRGGHNKKQICLSVLCLKELLMMQRSAEGKRVRRYFLLAEETLRCQLSGEVKALQAFYAKHEQYKRFMEELEAKEGEQHTEEYYQNLMETRFRNQLLSRQSDYGQMDVHLSNEIIELKHWRDYKHAMGQLLAYGKNLHKPLVAVFFGHVPDDENVILINDLLSGYNINVRYFDENNNMISVNA